MKKLKVAILGATGAVGQRFLSLLEAHPWFSVSVLAASEKSAGKRYGDAVNWQLGVLPEAYKDMEIVPCEPGFDADLVFSALPGDLARAVESKFREAGYKISSNASAFRRDENVPLLIPEVNPEHLGLIKKGKGFIITNPNCSTTQMVLALKPLHDAFRLKTVRVTTLQALSGAGYPGVPSMDIVDNVVPYIGGEEEKLEWEPLKLLGELKDGKITLAKIAISASCNRVASRDGHLECAFLQFEADPSVEEIKECLKGFRGEPQRLDLPSAPKHPIIVVDEPDRPQPQKDRDREKGMAAVVGRIRKDKLGTKMVILGHNTIRGAAGGAILNAELLKAKGYL